MNYKRKPVKSFRLHPSLLEQLKKVSKEQGLSQTAFLERALYREIFRYEQEQEQAA
ncbi:MAG: hypothetical protein ABW116_14975 [Candidatus Sedimenticola sp. 20ELBAFRAG]